MRADEIIRHNVGMFQLAHGKPFADALCAEEITIQKVIDALKIKMAPIPTGQELWGMKIYTDESVPGGKVRFKMKGITVAEVYAFEPKEAVEKERGRG